MEYQDIKIGMIGHFGGDKNFTDGQTVKTKELKKAIEHAINNEVRIFDTYRNARNIIKLFNGIQKLLKNNEIIILIVSSRGYKIILPILLFFNQKYHRKILDVVVGGSRYKIFDKNNIIKVLQKRINTIFVETDSLKEKYIKHGISNVEVLPNFKNLKIFDTTEEYEKKQIIKICTFTRVCKEKGIEDAINSVIYANKTLNKDIFYLDIYGLVENNYVEQFNELQKDFPDYIKYKGIVDYDKSSETIHNYDLMLFLTYWEGEGFPGTIIDAFSAGVPVIATEWNCNSEIIKDEYTGILVPIKSPEIAGQQLIYCYENQKEIFEMKKNCIKEAYNYLPEKAITILTNKL